jgi:hypothetical protein
MRARTREGHYALLRVRNRVATGRERMKVAPLPCPTSGRGWASKVGRLTVGAATDQQTHESSNRAHLVEHGGEAWRKYQGGVGGVGGVGVLHFDPMKRHTPAAARLTNEKDRACGS